MLDDKPKADKIRKIHIQTTVVYNKHVPESPSELQHAF